MNERDIEIEKKALEIFKNWPRTEIVFGNGAIKDTGKIASKFGKSVLIVIGKGSVKKNGSLDLLLDSITKANMEAIIFEGVEPNPSKETIETIAKTYLEGNFDVTIALGGGSPMDAAKAALILTGLNESDISQYFGVGNASKKLERISPCICIPTTSGSSSEVTRYSNVTVKALGVKKLISDIAMHPHYAIVDPLLTTSCQGDLTMTVGLDTLTHAMEGYLNTVQDEGNADINERALLSIELTFRWLKVAVDEPENIDARKMLSYASVLGGTVIGGDKFKGTGGPHMNSFSWAETISHGKSTGIMLPYYITYYAKNPKVIEKLKPIAKMLDISEEGGLGIKVAQGMLDWYKSMGFATKISEVNGWKDQYLEKAINDAAQNEMKLKAMPNPVPLDKVKDIIGPIIQAAVDGNLEKLSHL
jgi:alcohol dehydrogenase